MTNADPRCPPVRVGIVLDALEQPSWICRALEVAISSGRMTVSLVLLTRADDGSGLERRVSSTPIGPRWLRTIYDRFERVRFRPNGEAFQLRRVDAIVGAPSAPRANTTASSAALSSWITTLREAETDIVLNLSQRCATRDLVPGGELGGAAFALSAFADLAAPPDGLAEVLHGDGIVRARLELMLRDGAPSACVVENVTNAHPFSARITASNAALHAVPLLDRLLRNLARSRESMAPTGQGPLPVPALTPTALLRLSARYAQAVWEGRRLSPQWELAYARTAPPPRSGAPELDVSRYRAIRPPADRFWADPFPIRVGGRDFVFIEELPYSRNLGHIAVFELAPDGKIGEVVPVLERPFHLSYPFLFEYEGATYLLPEMALEGRLELYRATELPYKWELAAVLMEGSFLVDATLVEIDGRWWMFACALEENRGEWNNLVLYHAPTPLGPWVAHERNPVVSDVRSARPAGRVYHADGAWYRPAQDCARSYGGEMSVRRIVKLTPSEYEEIEVARLRPDRRAGFTGLHTLNAVDGLSVIDRKRLVPRRRGR